MNKIEQQIESLKNEGFYSRDCTESEKVATTMQALYEVVKAAEKWVDADNAHDTDWNDLVEALDNLRKVNDGD